MEKVVDSRKLSSLERTSRLGDVDAGLLAGESLLDIASAGEASGAGTVDGAGEEGLTFRHSI
jgi:hypothetical protein